MPSKGIASPADNANSRRQARATQAKLGRFRQSAAAVTRPAAGAENAALTAELAAVAQAVQAMAGMERAGIMGDYAARIRFAHRHLPKHQVAGTVQALKEEQRAKLAALARKTAQELKGRLAVVRRCRRLARLDGPTA